MTTTEVDAETRQKVVDLIIDVASTAPKSDWIWQTWTMKWREKYWDEPDGSRQFVSAPETYADLVFIPAMTLIGHIWMEDVVGVTFRVLEEILGRPIAPPGWHPWVIPFDEDAA
jgi:hypothetical protein